MRRKTKTKQKQGNAQRKNLELRASSCIIANKSKQVWMGSGTPVGGNRRGLLRNNPMSHSVILPCCPYKAQIHLQSYLPNIANHCTNIPREHQFRNDKGDKIRFIILNPMVRSVKGFGEEAGFLNG